MKTIERIDIESKGKKCPECGMFQSMLMEEEIGLINTEKIDQYQKVIREFMSSRIVCIKLFRKCLACGETFNEVKGFRCCDKFISEK